MTLTALLRRLAAQVLELAAENVALAKVEMAGKIRYAVVAAACLVLALLMSVAILATLTACLVLAFALIVPPWLAALIVTALYAVVAAIALLVARANVVRVFPPIPREAIRKFKENIEWAKLQATSNRR